MLIEDEHRREEDVRAPPVRGPHLWREAIGYVALVLAPTLHREDAALHVFRHLTLPLKKKRGEEVQGEAGVACALSALEAGPLPRCPSSNAVHALCVYIRCHHR